MKKSILQQISKEIAISTQAISSPQRIAILLAIGNGEACVCHLETALGWRQAYISQHLMALRKADLLADRRKGRYVYYSLKSTSYLDLIIAAAEVSGLAKDTVYEQINTQVYPSCDCPDCTPALIQVATLESTSLSKEK